MKKKKSYPILIFFLILIFLSSFTYFLNSNRNLSNIESYFKNITTNIYKVFINKDNNSYNSNIKNTLKANTNSEVESLKKVLELNHTLGRFTYVNATIISRNVSYWFQELRIDKGSNSGIKKNNAVITPEGLIGKISSTTKNSSTVKLLTSSSYKVSVKVNNGYGILTKYDKKKKVFIVENIDIDLPIKKNDIVETSGLGGVFPSGIYIGKVKSMKKDSYEASKILEIDPNRDFNNIKYVTILENEDD